MMVASAFPAIPTEETVHQALALWHQSDTHGTPFNDLLIWQQLMPTYDGNLRRTTNQLLLAALVPLAQEDLDYQKILELRFFQEEPGHRIANILHVAEGTVWRKQREAISRLTAILQAQEQQARQQRQARFAARLETPTYSQLIGVEAHLANLAAQLNQAGPPWLVGIEGMGGIGKTALADALTRHLMGSYQWQDFAWVTARQQIFNGGGAIKPIAKPALTTEMLIEALVKQLLSAEIGAAVLPFEQKRTMLQERLRAHPHLIVIDNLETLLDIESLLSTLRELVNPTKILLTSRFSRFHETDIFHFVLPELNEADALTLVRQEAQVRNLPALAAAPTNELQAIYATVGGNPLAIRLVVGQTHIHPLTRVLNNLQAAQGYRVEQLYRYIYRQAWENLDNLAQQTLLLMPLVTEAGGDLDYLVPMAEAAGLSAIVVSDALERLVALNLVDNHGGLQERRYTIHALTRTFLQEQILKWYGETLDNLPPNDQPAWQ
ncbi:MAG: hypothetical protein KF832_09005 [Caldilineaceae bacterium]|nr:hypothetical protein [Caldilineaceae bacterium]